MLQIIECPRDAMQGLHEFIPTETKIQYLNSLLEVGFHSLDFGSFVSPKAIPQLRDTEEVLAELNTTITTTQLLAIVANVRGAEQASAHKAIQYIGFPLSVSETFQQRNTNKSIAEALDQVKQIQDLCAKSGQQQVVYLSMGFGNPYGDPYSPELLINYVEQLKTMGIGIISLSDTIGVANAELIHTVFAELVPAHPEIVIGAHLHSHPSTAAEKVRAAHQAGCRRFDSALKGFGGCPMANDELVGNMPTEMMIEEFNNLGLDVQISKEKLAKSLQMAATVFPH